MGILIRSFLLMLLSLPVGAGIAAADAPVKSHGDEIIAILGTGDMGDSFGPRLAGLGYKIVYGSRNPASKKVIDLVARTGNGASANTQKNAAQQGDIVFLALPWPAMETVVQSIGDLRGKILIDMSWPPATYAADGYEQITIETSSAEMIQGWNPDAMVVKAFLTLGSNVIDDPSTASGPVSVPIASNHRIAKEVTARLAAEMGLDPVDAGPLRFARNIESLTELMLVPYAQGRDEAWDFYFRRSNFFVCNAYEGDGSENLGQPVVDSENLADFPRTQPPLADCE